MWVCVVILRKIYNFGGNSTYHLKSLNLKGRGTECNWKTVVLVIRNWLLFFLWIVKTINLWSIDKTSLLRCFSQYFGDYFIIVYQMFSSVFCWTCFKDIRGTRVREQIFIITWLFGVCPNYFKWVGKFCKKKVAYLSDPVKLSKGKGKALFHRVQCY